MQKVKRRSQAEGLDGHRTTISGKILSPKVELGFRAMVELVFHQRRRSRGFGGEARGTTVAFRSWGSGRALCALRPIAGTRDILAASVARPGMVLVYRRVLWRVVEGFRVRVALGAGMRGMRIVGPTGRDHQEVILRAGKVLGPREEVREEEERRGAVLGAGVGHLRARVRFEEAGCRRKAGGSGALCERTGLEGNSIAQRHFGTRGGREDQVEALLQDLLPPKPMNPPSPPAFPTEEERAKQFADLLERRSKLVERVDDWLGLRKPRPRWCLRR